MTSEKRVVLYTNVLISAFLFDRSIPQRVLTKATEAGRLLLSERLLFELETVLARRKFDRYVSMEKRSAFVLGLTEDSDLVVIIRAVRVCRDPKDDMVLELAVNGKADPIVTGDGDLLSLGSFDGIAIVSPADYLLL